MTIHRDRRGRFQSKADHARSVGVKRYWRQVKAVARNTGRTIVDARSYVGTKALRHPTAAGVTTFYGGRTRYWFRSSAKMLSAARKEIRRKRKIEVFHMVVFAGTTDVVWSSPAVAVKSAKRLTTIAAKQLRAAQRAIDSPMNDVDGAPALEIVAGFIL